MDIFELLFSNKAKKRGPDRRQSSTERFKGSERRQSRDRRGLGYGIAFKTARPLAPIEEWLLENLPDRHRFSIDGMSDDLSVKHVKVVVIDEADRKLFRNFLSDYLRGIGS